LVLAQINSGLIVQIDLNGFVNVDLRQVNLLQLFGWVVVGAACRCDE